MAASRTRARARGKSSVVADMLVTEPAPRRKRDGNKEGKIQGAAVKYIRTVAPQTVVFHVANGGLRSKSEAARMKWQGVLAGVPDLCILHDDGKCSFIEIKTVGNGASDEQREFLSKLLDLKIPFAVAYSVDDVRLALAMFGVPTRESANPETHEAGG